MDLVRSRACRFREIKGSGELDRKSSATDFGKERVTARQAFELSSRLAEHSENGYLVLDLFQNRSHWEQ
jgi:hypothetical protein